jgi:hypothetical protein
MEKLKEHFNDLSKLIQDAFIAYQNLLTALENQHQHKFLQEDFFRFFQYQQYFMINIQLSKILEHKSNQKRNIVTLCNRILQHDFRKEIIKYYGELQPSVRHINKNYTAFITSVKEVKDKILSQHILIAKVGAARDKVYAHTDVNRVVDFPTLVELETLIELAAHAYNNIHGVLLGGHMDFTKGLINIRMKDVIRIFERGHTARAK